MGQVGITTKWVCIDSDIIIDYLRGKGEGAKYLETLLRKFVCCLSSITTYELYIGAVRTGTTTRIDSLTSWFIILPFNLQTSKEAALIYESLRTKGQLIGMRDILIAATCKVYEIMLITRNVAHFSRIEGLRVMSPGEAANMPG